MVNFFRGFESLKVPALFILLLLIRLPMIIMGTPLTVPELKWMLVAERMAEGFVLYRDIWENIEPFSAVFYSFLYILFGKSHLSYQIISLFLVFIQALIFNTIFNHNGLFREKTMIPSLIYIVFASLFFDFNTLSPVLLSLTFILIILYLVAYIIKAQESEETIFYLGLFTGVSVLFYYPSIVLILLGFFTITQFSKSGIRRYILFITGLALPIVSVIVYFFWKDALEDLYHNFILGYFSTSRVFFVENSNFYLIITAPAICLTFSWLVLLAGPSVTSYISNLMRYMILYLLLACGVFVLNSTYSPYQLYIFLPGLVFFISAALLQVKKKRFQEFSFVFVFSFILLVKYGAVYGFAVNNELVPTDKITVDIMPFHEKYTGKRVWVIGEDYDYYHTNKAGMPYLNYELSQRHLGNLENFEVISQVYKNFETNKPEVIIDQQNLMQEIFQHIPGLKADYERSGDIFYIRK